VKVPSLHKIKTEDLDLLYVDAIRKWANAPHETDHADMAAAVANELERRGRPVPTEEVRAETDFLISTAIAGSEALKARVIS
jgi:predicted deacylase